MPDDKSESMKECITKELEDTNIVIGGMISDPGGHKRKNAEKNCKYEKMKNPKEFEKKHGSSD
ncbi:hypothetical protein C9J48_23985 [Photobacterium profundum]|uniref:Uncharacterized protein n=1 Tax=Photobacterium profundum 3TCK TaxID=314280 RepID=Q1Z9F8_9GAMM|nr:hypothetical protein [Photobacterium profundum]EAS44800.1 hypothetical protein P3TCK_19990 [Photobacterium profundum 3TCK]PSV59321.1 hypothetical protein C9J48_23985 [Photobacterium profundum]